VVKVSYADLPASGIAAYSAFNLFILFSQSFYDKY